MAASRKVVFKDEDHGWRQLASIFTLDKGDTTVDIGFINSKVHQSNTESATPLTVASIAAIHEFGSSDGIIPERSFMRSAVDDNKVAIKKMIEKLSGQVIDGRFTKKAAMAILGQKVADFIKQKIVQGPFTPLAPSTVHRKHSSKPLIDTGQMLNSVTFRVRKGKKKGENE